MLLLFLKLQQKKEVYTYLENNFYSAKKVNEKIEEQVLQGQHEMAKVILEVFTAVNGLTSHTSASEAINRAFAKHVSKLKTNPTDSNMNYSSSENLSNSIHNV